MHAKKLIWVCSFVLFLFCCYLLSLYNMLMSTYLIFLQFRCCPQLPFLLRSVSFSPVKCGRVQDDCNAAETTAMVFLPDQTKGRVAHHPGLWGGLKRPCAFRIWIGLGQLSWQAGCTANRSSKMRRRETHWSCLSMGTDTKIKQDIKRKTHREIDWGKKGRTKN